MLKVLGKLFGSKSERDVKQLRPLVEKIKAAYDQLQSLSNDELRGKTFAFKERIKEYLAELDEEIDGLKAEAEEIGLPMQQKTTIYDKIDKLNKDRDQKLETILMDLLPEAFAVVKETARRFTENDELEVTALDFDKDLAASKPNVRVEGDKAFWNSTWIAAGSEVKWNMVHYDVQLIGGIVLHQGKIAEMATGEGKTLVGTLPAYLNALSGMRLHIRSEERRVGKEAG